MRSQVVSRYFRRTVGMVRHLLLRAMPLTQSVTHRGFLMMTFLTVTIILPSSMIIMLGAIPAMTMLRATSVMTILGATPGTTILGATPGTTIILGATPIPFFFSKLVSDGEGVLAGIVGHTYISPALHQCAASGSRSNPRYFSLDVAV